jgi:hypothetical protein
MYTARNYFQSAGPPQKQVQNYHTIQTQNLKKEKKTLQIKEEVEQIQESQQSQDWCWTQDPHSLQRSLEEFFALGHRAEILMGQCHDAMRLYVARMQD